jgi:hypothetical protein
VKVIAWLTGIGTLIAAAAYMVVSLNRWEWNRALYFGLVVLIAEVGLATGLVLRRLKRLAQAQEESVDPAVREILRSHRPPGPDRFAWLRESPSRLNVFVTLLVGGGVIISGAAWLVDRVASRTGAGAREQRLARQLAAIAYPREGLLVDEATALAQDVPGIDDAQVRTLLRGRGGRR